MAFLAAPAFGAAKENSEISYVGIFSDFSTIWDMPFSGCVPLTFEAALWEAGL
jgi:hypothetical protein